MIDSVIRSLVALAVALLVVSCSVPPKPDLPALRHEAPLAGLPAPHGGAWPDPKWWTRYHDTQLDALEEKALSSAPALDQARQRFDSALRAVDVARATGGASFQASAQVQRQRMSEHGLIPPQLLGFTWYNQGDLGIQFQYDFDFWGKQRAAVAAAVDSAHAAEAERSTATLMLTAAVADTYFGWQADQALLELATARVDALERTRDIARKRVARGVDAADTLHTADAQIAGAHELRAAYAGSAPIRRAALAALLGVAPSELPELRPSPLPDVAESLPDDIGIDLLARRPDIAASRWQVEAAMQQVNQARAEFYPDISLGAMVGLSSIDLGKLLSAGSRVANIGPALHLPIFNLGRLRAAYGVTEAQLAAAAAQYDATVVSAAQDVATQALNLEQIAARRRQRAAQLSAVRALNDTADARARRGLTDDRAVLAAQVQVLEQRDAATTLKAQAISSEIALTKALGGGYRITPIPQPATGESAGTPPPKQSAASISTPHKSDPHE